MTAPEEYAGKWYRVNLPADANVPDEIRQWTKCVVFVKDVALYDELEVEVRFGWGTVWLFVSPEYLEEAPDDER